MDEATKTAAILRIHLPPIISEVDASLVSEIRKAMGECAFENIVLGDVENPTVGNENIHDVKL